MERTRVSMGAVSETYRLTLLDLEAKQAAIALRDMARVYAARAETTAEALLSRALKDERKTLRREGG